MACFRHLKGNLLAEGTNLCIAAYRAEKVAQCFKGTLAQVSNKREITEKWDEDGGYKYYV